MSEMRAAILSSSCTGGGKVVCLGEFIFFLPIVLFPNPMGRQPVTVESRGNAGILTDHGGGHTSRNTFAWRARRRVSGAIIKRGTNLKCVLTM